MDKPLRDRTALVTGGGSGIGRTIAMEMAQRGAAVAVAGRRRAVVDDAAAAIEAAGGRALAVVGDVARPDDAARIVAATVERFGTLHVLVNNAGIARHGALGELRDEDVDAVIDVDLKGPIHVTRAALEHLRAQRDAGGSSVINLSSSLTFHPVPRTSLYAAAKAGLETLTRCWAVELAPDRVRVNAIAPGVVRTPLFQTLMPEAAVERFLRGVARQTPLGRVGEPEDVARLACFLADPANDWLSGAIIPLDGALSLAGG